MADELNARQSGSRNPARMEGVPLTLTGQVKTFESRTDLVERENRTTKKNLSSARHFSIQYPFKAKLAKTKEENLKFRYDKREE